MLTIPVFETLIPQLLPICISLLLLLCPCFIPQQAVNLGSAWWSPAWTCRWAAERWWRRIKSHHRTGSFFLVAPGISVMPDEPHFASYFMLPFSTILKNMPHFSQTIKYMELWIQTTFISPEISNILIFFPSPKLVCLLFHISEMVFSFNWQKYKHLPGIHLVSLPPYIKSPNPIAYIF